MNIQVSNKDNKSPYEKFRGKPGLPRYAKSLVPFGEIGIILRTNKIQSKIHNRGQKIMMAGYGSQNGNVIYRMYKFDMKKVTQTRDIRWTKKLYGETNLKNIDEDSDSDFDSEYEIKEDEKLDDDEKYEKRDGDKVDKRVHNALKKLHTSYNPALSALVVEDDLALVGGTDDLHKNPITFMEAWNHPDKEEKVSWQTAIKKELNDMINRNIWRHSKRDNIPKEQRLIGNKWEFKKRRMGSTAQEL